jgi:hypothetical protein
MKKSQVTKIIYMTDQMLLNLCLKDECFSKYSCIIIDEAHERSITIVVISFLLAYIGNADDKWVHSILNSEYINFKAEFKFFDFFIFCSISFIQLIKSSNSFFCNSSSKRLSCRASTSSFLDSSVFFTSSSSSGLSGV